MIMSMTKRMGSRGWGRYFVWVLSRSFRSNLSWVRYEVIFFTIIYKFQSPTNKYSKQISISNNSIFKTLFSWYLEFEIYLYLVDCELLIIELFLRGLRRSHFYRESLYPRRSSLFEPRQSSRRRFLVRQIWLELYYR